MDIPVEGEKSSSDEDDEDDNEGDEDYEDDNESDDEEDGEGSGGDVPAVLKQVSVGAEVKVREEGVGNSTNCIIEGLIRGIGSTR